MEQSGGYRTKQREQILSFLIDNRHRHITADDIVGHMKAQGKAVGKSTVYRYLDRLVEAGEVRKYFWEEGVSACFQYSGNSEGCRTHFHLKCLDCGALLHVECNYLEALAAHVGAEHGFEIDQSKTVLYGHCSACSGKGANGNG